MSVAELDLDLARKYSQPGPRYTSYPPATQFGQTLDLERLRGSLVENNRTDSDLSLYFHLPFCQSLCWFCGCTTVITREQSQSALYLKYLAKELELVAPLLNPRRQVAQLHFGGGTPTFLLPDEIRKLGDAIRHRFTLSEAVEAGVEIDPRDLTRDHVQALRDIGFNRASIGVQDHNPAVQEAVHRIQPLEMTKQAVDWIGESGFRSLNIDLIYGLPQQTVASFAKTLDEAIALKPDRFAVFSYAHVPWLKPTQKGFKAESLPSPDLKLELLKLTIGKLCGSGYAYIGMDHFARENDELATAQKSRTLQRNFQGYSTHGDADLYGFGVSSISGAAGVYWQNLKDLNAYYAALDEGRWPVARTYFLSDDDKIRRRVIMQIMCGLELDFAALSKELGIGFKDYFAKELAGLAGLQEDGLIAETANGLVVTARGRWVVRNIAMHFDAYLPAMKDRQFSKTI